MRGIRLRWLLVLVLGYAPSTSCATDAIKVMTFNIRYGTAPDGENSWPLRKESALKAIRDFQPALLGLQEALRDQLDTLLDAFPRYVSVGVSREFDGSGEYSALVYDRTRFDLLQANTFWLSDTPDVQGSHTWGNDLPRACTWARLVDRQTNHVIRVFTTHWDHQFQPSRLKSGQTIAERVTGIAPEEPVLVLGDFNAAPDNPARQALANVGLRDSFAVLHPEQANDGTFHAFQGVAVGGKIDAILMSKHWRVLQAEIVRARQDNLLPSDHYPVTATLELIK